MGDWEDVDKAPEDETAFGIKKVDPIAYSGQQSSPELRWDAEAPKVRPVDVGPAPKRLSTGRRVETWVPGGPAEPAGPPAPPRFLIIVKRLLATMVPLGFLAGLAVLMLRMYGML